MRLTEDYRYMKFVLCDNLFGVVSNILNYFRTCCMLKYHLSLLHSRCMLSVSLLRIGDGCTKTSEDVVMICAIGIAFI
jgi:hypothetical protein